ncbi:hypothetical protein ONZ45_g19072 [Pleurotus djamor]|nr:hypothetical protein ONZ45_g19072 [Pleurotus djamor]
MDVVPVGPVSYQFMSNRALYIPELLKSIFLYLPDGSHTNCALVCKAWTDIALDVGWHEVRDIKLLFQLLGPLVEDEDNEYHFERPIQPTDWIRFQKYNYRVRVLFGESGDSSCNSSVYALVSSMRPFPILLPNLHELYCNMDLDFMLLVSHNTIEICNLFTEDPPITTFTAINLLLRCVPLYMPNLVELDMPFHSIDVSETDIHAICEMFAGLPLLRKVHLPASLLTPETTLILSKLQFLHSMKTSVHAIPNDSETFSADLDSESFPSLTHLTLNMTLRRGQTCFNVDPPFSRGSLTHIAIHSRASEFIEDYESIIAAIIHNWPLIESINIENHFPLSTLHVPFSVFQPLLSCKRLTSLSLESPHTSDYTEDMFIDIFTALPLLRHLDLGGGRPIYAQAPPISMTALSNLAAHCPRLEYLCLYMSFNIANAHGEDIPSADSVTPFKALQMLALWDAPIEEPQFVALYLSRVLPDTCEVTHNGESQRDKWKQAISTLSVLRMARGETAP